MENNEKEKNQISLMGFECQNTSITNKSYHQISQTNNLNKNDNYTKTFTFVSQESRDNSLPQNNENYQNLNEFKIFHNDNSEFLSTDACEKLLKNGNNIITLAKRKTKTKKKKTWYKISNFSLKN